MSDSFPIYSADQIAALKQGDASLWSRFIADVSPFVDATLAWGKWRFAPHVREDMKQRILSDLPVAMGKYAGSSSLRTFIQRICIYRCIDEVRRQFRERQIFVDIPREQEDQRASSMEDNVPDGSEFDPVQTIVRRERAQIVVRMLESIEERCRHILRMFYLEELSYKEMAARLRIAINTVGPRLGRCYAKLKGLIENREELRDYFFG